MSETICTILERWNRERPDALAISFFGDGEVESDRLTFGQLFRESRKIAAATRRFAEAGDRVVILLPPSIEFVSSLVGCMMGGTVAVPIAPARKRQTASRLAAIVRDAEVALVVTTQQLAESVEAAIEQDPTIRRPAILTMDQVTDKDGIGWQPPPVAPSDLAMFQYTSGSTDRPKGVTLTHGNFIANLKMIREAFGHTDTTTQVSWLPQYHDMGLVGDTLQPLFNGRPRVFMPPQAFLERPIRWLRLIARHKNVTSGAPDFAYDYCVRRIKPEQCVGLDLSSWRVAYNGSEPVRAETLERFARAFAQFGFRPEAQLPCYGLAEGALLVSGGPGPGRQVTVSVDPEDISRGSVTVSDAGKRLVGCGRPVNGLTVTIIDPTTHEPSPPDTLGEIWVSGPSIAPGYWRQEEATLRTFRGRLRGADTTYLRTGDLGFLRDGELFILGRISDKIIVRGRNLYPDDIECTVQESHPALEPHAGAAFSVEREGREQLVVVQEVRREERRRIDASAILSAVRRAVNEAHGVMVSDLVLLRPGTVLKTTSGKIRRREMRQLFLDGEIEAIEGSRPRTVVPSTVAKGTSPHAEPAAAPRSRPEDVADLLAWLRDYAEHRMNSRLMDERKCIPPHVVLDFGNHGLLGLQGPRELGGRAFNHRDTLRVFEQLGAIDQTMALFVGIHNVLGTGPILRAGTASARAEHLPALVAGRQLGAFALTEPGAGSNPRAIQTRAVPAGPGRWRLSGTKYWSGAAAWAGVINVFAKLEGPGGESLGSAAFAVRQGSPGLRHGVEAPTMGMRAIVQNTIHLEGVEVGEDELLGEPGEGLAVAQEAMVYGRLAIAASCLGGMQRCAQLMHRYASRRRIAGERLMDNAVTIDRLGATTAAIAATDALIGRIAEALDHGIHIPDGIFAAVKILAPELFWTTADRLVQMLGGRGYVETNAAPQMLRDARVLRIFEGPTEAMCAYLGARLVNDETELIGFLETQLHAPDAAQTLQTSLAQVRDLLRHGDVPTRTRLRYRLGELTAWAVLAGALEPAATDQSARWARSILSRLARALPMSAPPTTIEQITADIASYGVRIGDVESSVAGEDESLDPILRRDGPTAPDPAPPEVDPPETSVLVSQLPAASQPASASARSAVEITTFLRSWMADRLDLSTDEVDPQTPFAELGADSVMAVELVIDLGDYVGQKLDDTLPWEAPNIAAVAERLSAPGPATATATAPADTAPAGDVWSEVEVDLRKLEQRLGGS